MVAGNNFTSKPRPKLGCHLCHEIKQLLDKQCMSSIHLMITLATVNDGMQMRITMQNSDYSKLLIGAMGVIEYRNWLTRTTEYRFNRQAMHALHRPISRPRSPGGCFTRGCFCSCPLPVTSSNQYESIKTYFMNEPFTIDNLGN